MAGFSSKYFAHVETNGHSGTMFVADKYAEGKKLK
jgi:hypothetical protein